MPSRNASSLKALQESGTVVIADTADLQQIARFNPSEGTTNPSLLYLAAQQPAYSHLLDKTIKYARTLSVTEAQRLGHAVEYLAVQFGCEIYKLTGRVSTEVDVSHSFDTLKTVEAALRVIKLYAAEGISKESVRIKISASWEGIQAARILGKEHGISVLVTIVFGMVQAITAAEAGVTCIAPYIGRISDWHKTHGHVGAEDMGVKIVQDMQNYLRKYGHRTQLMGASFRNPGQVKNLAGADLLTIAPGILDLLDKSNEEVVPRLTAASAEQANMPQETYINDEPKFRWTFNGDACAVEKSAEAMRRFAEDTSALKELLSALL
ncbi:hypothetical protein LTR20_006707 [Exophiala xenobiotica]|nr:hypothetical protein LTR40_010961 [Exophiala xenobiotica]KAK5371307.1 hypothetical protein LTS13_006684 [Exophiala xenobiotica]KAK5394851.1 hypothetical protein LTR79_007467 [Exophiala xenobiotica]KAK5413149.1 hypothetical protein LTR90_007271 [Exophiala xenobiotica]KAK5461783.1 hypothetical protein LTR20_006707 [Exophiala xenobiotica]